MNALRNATLRQLRILDCAARNLSFARAGEALHLTQPAVSMQIRELENMCGLPLFERRGRRLFLTDAGRELAEHARRMLALLADADERLAAIKGLRGGRVTLGVVSTAKYFAPKLLAAFRALHPDIELRLTLANREATIQSVRDNAVDLAIMGQPPEDLPALAETFADHPSVIIAAPDHARAKSRKLALRELADETFVAREPGSGTRSAMDRYFRRHRFTPKIGMVMASNESIKQAVMAGMGIAFISAHTIGLECRVGELAVLRVEDLPLVRKWMVVRLADKLLSPAAEALRAFVLAEGRAAIERQFGPLAACGPARKPVRRVAAS